MRPQPNLRRRFLQSSVSTGLLSAAAVAGLLKPSTSWAWLPFFNFNPPGKPAAPTAPAAPIPSFLPPPRVKTPLERLVEDMHKANPEFNTAVDILSPDIAVDGASIMLTFQALLPEVDGLAVFIERNPSPMAAAFLLAPNVVPEMKLMVRLAQSSNIAVVARSQGKFYKNLKFVKVTQGGCSDSFTEAEARHRQEVLQRYPAVR